jgi:[ribosomal protein S5]-alanine N-acetyltransferase
VSRDPIEFPVEGLRDESVLLRLRSDADLSAMVEACQDPEIPRWTRVPDHYGRREAREWAGEAARQHEAGEGIHLVIVDAGDERLLGSIGIHRIDSEERRCDIGYWLAREARGRGAMTRAVHRLSGWIFGELPVDRIEIVADPRNAASRAVAERAGFRFEGVLRSYVVMKGCRRDMAMYSLLRTDPF